MRCPRRRPARSSVSDCGAVCRHPRLANDRSAIAAAQSPDQLLHPRHWKRAKGYANGIVAEGRIVFVAGQVGWNADQKFQSQDFVGQTRQALQNIIAVVREAGGGPEHITRLTWVITDKKGYLSQLAEVGV